jgi:glycosyltransferase involved in cell wall biosynthesis
VIVWAGGLWDWLDPLTLIRAVATLARSRPNVRLLFMGGRTPSPHVGEMGVAAAAEALARRHDPDGRTVLFNRGWVPYEERGALLLEADIGASLHHRTVESRYAFRTRILDYIWAGLPMVVSGGDALGDQVGRLGLGYTVPEGDPDSVAAALAELLDDEGARSSRAERFAVARAEMAWSRAVEPLVEFLRRGEPAADRPAAGVAFRPTPVWGLPGRALRALRAGGARGLARETERYLAWRRRPR